MVTRAQREIVKPNPCYALPVAPSEIGLTKSSKKALLVPEWNDTMKAEFLVLKKNETWTLIPHNSDNNVINSLWIFKVKQRDDGTVERLKDQLVVNGLRQFEGTKYNETFSHVVKFVSLWSVLTLAFTDGWKLLQVDMSNSFLHWKIGRASCDFITGWFR